MQVVFIRSRDFGVKTARLQMSHKNIMLMWKNVQYWINIPPENAIGRASENDYSDYDDSEFVVLWETAVQSLTDLQRLIFFAITIVVVVVAVLGNILVLYVNLTRLAQRNQFGNFKNH